LILSKAGANQNGIEAKPQTGFGNFAHCFSAEIRYRNVAASSSATVTLGGFGSVLASAVNLHIGGVAFKSTGLKSSSEVSGASEISCL